LNIYLPKLLFDASALSILMPFALIIFNHKHQRGEISTIVYYIIISLVFELYSYTTSQLGLNNHSMLYIFTFVEFIILTLFYLRLSSKMTEKYYILLIASLYMGWFLYYFYFKANLFEFSNTIKFLEVATISLFNSYFFYKHLKAEPSSKSKQTYLFWLYVAIAIYFTGFTLAYIVYALLYDFDTIMKSTPFWQLQAWINLISNFLYALFFLKLNKRNKHITSIPK
jgi:hypothetical protein